MASEARFLSPRQVGSALKAYAQRRKSRGWQVSAKARLYDLAEQAFDPDAPRFEAFEKIYAELRSYWQIFRGGTRAAPEEIFDRLMSPACQACRRVRLDLLSLSEGDGLEAVWHCLVAMQHVKTLRTGKISAMAVSKFLHFFNPRLFPIYDGAVIRRQVFPCFREALVQSREQWQDPLAAVRDDPAYGAGLGTCLEYLLFAADCFRGVDAAETMRIFTKRFKVMLEAESQGLEPPEDIDQYYATAFEFALVGACLLRNSSGRHGRFRSTDTA